MRNASRRPGRGFHFYDTAIETALTIKAVFSLLSIVAKEEGRSHDAQVAEMLAGKSLETLQQDIKLDEFSDLKMYDEWLPQNIEGVYQTLNEQSYFDRR